MLTKEKWIERYGGQALLDAEGFEVIPCENCDDTICHGWRVQKKTAGRVREFMSAYSSRYERDRIRRMMRAREFADPSRVVPTTPTAPVTPSRRITRESYFCAVCGCSDNLIWCAIEEPVAHKVCAAHLSADMLRCQKCNPY